VSASLQAPGRGELQKLGDSSGDGSVTTSVRGSATPIWRQSGMPSLLWMTFTGFSGFAVLLPVAPLWALRGGASIGGSGLVNGVLLLFTVLTQLLVSRALRRFDRRLVLVAGMTLLGLSAALYVVSDAIVPVLLLSAVRGIGFGVLTVTGSSAVAALVGSERRGEAIGLYGLTIAVPMLVLLPAGPWLASNVGFPLVFLIGALPLLGIPAAWGVADSLGATARATNPPPASGSGEPDGSAWSVYRRLLRPAALLLSVTFAGGAVTTFTPQMVPRESLATTGLLVLSVLAALCRWRAGRLADRFGAQPFLGPSMLLSVVGIVLVAFSIGDSNGTVAWPFLLGMALLGLSYGALQNLTLVVSFASVSPHDHDRASAAWNIGFDAGTALGSVTVGLLATAASFGSALWAVACLLLVALPIAVKAPGRRGARSSQG
jgi:predicted MFS family arabinose efflux permease